MRWDRERYLNYMTGRDASRPMFVELFGPLVGLEDEWRAQGATEAEVDLTAFAFDYVTRIDCGGHTGPIFDREPEVIEETDTFRIERDGLGRLCRLDKTTATIALPMDFPVKTMDDWLRLKPMFTWREDRVDAVAVDRAIALRDRGYLIEAFMPGGFDMARELMGEEVACMAYYDQPELMRDIVATIGDTATRTLDAVSRRVRIDRLMVHEDFAGRSGPLIGPDTLRGFVRPYYRRVWDMLADRGATLFGIDSDGNINPVIDALIDCGINELFPNEPAAGMDMVAVRREYGRGLMLRGGLDKHALRGTRADITRELEAKLIPEMMAGGIVFGLDHRIPNGVSIENYRFYVDTARAMLGLPPRERDESGWQCAA